MNTNLVSAWNPFLEFWKVKIRSGLNIAFGARKFVNKLKFYLWLTMRIRVVSENHPRSSWCDLALMHRKCEVKLSIKHFLCNTVQRLKPDLSTKNTLTNYNIYPTLVHLQNIIRNILFIDSFSHMYAIWVVFIYIHSTCDMYKKVSFPFSMVFFFRIIVGLYCI